MISPELRLRARTNQRRVLLAGLLTGAAVVVAEIAIAAVVPRHHNRAIAHRRVTGTALTLEIAVPIAFLLLLVGLVIVAARRGWFKPSALWGLDWRERRRVWKAARRLEPLPDEMKPLVVEQAVAAQRVAALAWAWAVLSAGELTLAILNALRGHTNAIEFVLAGVFAALVVPMRKQAESARRIKTHYSS